MEKRKKDKTSMTGKKMLVLILSALIIGTTVFPMFAAAQDGAMINAGHETEEAGIVPGTGGEPEEHAALAEAEKGTEEEMPAAVEADIAVLDDSEADIKEGQAVALYDAPQSVTVSTCENGIPVLNITLNETSLAAVKSGEKGTKYTGNSVTYITPNGKTTMLSDVTLKGRGNSTWSYNKKPFQIKFAKKQDLFGQGKSKTWILLANYLDYSHLRNDVAFNLAAQNGIPGTLPVGMFVEVYFNGIYEGLYYLTRKVEVGTVPLEDRSGIITEIEEIHTPDDLYRDSVGGTRVMIKETVIDSDVEAEQQAVLDNFMVSFNAFEQAVINKDLAEAGKYADIESFAKYFLLADFAGNQDMFGSSCYMYKDGDDDLIHAGPMWDFDIAYGANTLLVTKESTNPLRTWGYMDVRESPDSIQQKRWCDLYEYLMNVPGFRTMVRTLYWSSVRETLDGINDYAVAKASAIDAAVTRDIKKWHPNVSVSGERKKLLDYINNRIKYFDILYGGEIDEEGILTMRGAYKSEPVKTEKTNDGFVVIRNIKGRVLEVANGNKGNGAAVRWSDAYNGTDAQKWLILKNGAVIAKETGLLLTQASDGSFTAKCASLKNGIQENAQTFLFRKTSCPVADTLLSAPVIVTEKQAVSAPVPEAYGTALREGTDYTVETLVEGTNITYTYTGIGDFSGKRSVSTTIAVDPGFSSNYYYKVVSVLNAKKAMTIKNGSLENNANIQLGTFTGVLENYWRFNKQEDGTYIITNARSGLAVDISGGSKNNGGNVQQYKTNGNKTQRFIIDRHANGTCTLYNANSLKAVDVAGGSVSDGTNIQQYTSNGTRAQKWYIGAKGKDVALSGRYVIVSQSGKKDKAVSVKSTSYENGANVLMWDAATSQSRKWMLIRNNDAAGSFTIKSAYSGKVLDIAGGSKSAKANVQQYTPNGTNAQKWVIVESMNGGTYTIYSICSGLALDISGGSTANRANVQVYWPNGTAAQIWAFKTV